MRGEEPGEKERLFELLIHDLTGPLSVIAVSTNNLLRRPEGGRALTGRQQATLERILRNARRSQTLLREMVEILQAEAGLFRNESFAVDRVVRESILEVLEVALHQAVDDLAQHTRPKAFFTRLESYGVFVQISGKYARATFRHDHRKVQQIVRNLLSNALKHRRQRVDVKISGDPDLVVSIADDGPGIPEPDQEAVFRRFVQLKGDANAAVPGLGLGLAGVRTLVDTMGGKITLVSPKRSGAELSVSIPPLGE